MYPQADLTLLASRKQALRRRIAWNRARCADAAAGARRPLEWLDRALEFWRRLAPVTKLVAAPLGFLLVKKFALPRLKMLGPLLRWGPLAFSIERGLRPAPKNR